MWDRVQAKDPADSLTLPGRGSLARNSGRELLPLDLDHEFAFAREDDLIVSTTNSATQPLLAQVVLRGFSMELLEPAVLGGQIPWDSAPASRLYQFIEKMDSQVSG